MQRIYPSKTGATYSSTAKGCTCNTSSTHNEGLIDREFGSDVVHHSTTKHCSCTTNQRGPRLFLDVTVTHLLMKIYWSHSYRQFLQDCEWQDTDKNKSRLLIPVRVHVCHVKLGAKNHYVCFINTVLIVAEIRLFAYIIHFRVILNFFPLLLQQC